MDKENKKNIILIAAIFVIIAVLILIIIFIVVMDNKETETNDDETPLTGDNLTGDSIRNKAIESYNKLDTYKVRANANIHVPKSIFTATITATVKADANGKVDNKNKNLEMDVNLIIPLVGTKNMKTYIVGGEMYVKEDGEWTRTKLSESEKEDMYNKQNYLERETKNILKNSDVEYAGNETINGANVWVLNVKPGEEALNNYENYMLSEFGQSLEMAFEGSEVVDVEFKDVTMNCYVSEPGFIVRNAIYMNVTVYGEGGESKDIKVEMSDELYDFNEMVDISVPEEAK